ncbi:hypothetical protein GLOTRDRAFT_77508 [Gloeophyllum trabeum ATCC 11539]|uniref:intramembrane prenyl-peptidase Rce1 n=1 Tax=Gloeophyllum trabeum (strain ATCC 11539 / FP-39264 / Madison 617) TaxID=670483 RepID=S7Q429_GLOTA|nr:uncharacterized protein GLOTRDRAFT_77508 [Gloeophyllum trabeum ATCC 11539]EPQ54776.1 hypothetical protein GLOTRDRAFT_77508 [Gloeophyllum trabeum ATCC 11539]
MASEPELLEYFLAPPISLEIAHTLTLLFAAAYVGSLYLSKYTRLSFSDKSIRVGSGGSKERGANERWRDDPDVIRARLAIVSLVTVFCCFVVYAVIRAVSWYKVGVFYSTIVRLGFHLSSVESVYPFLLAPLLYLGPIYASYLGEHLPFQFYFSWRRDVVDTFISWQGVRNYVLGPITEEIVFRACVLSLYHLGGASRTWMIFGSPISFGFAHLHHAWEIYNRYGRTRTALKNAALTTLFQLSYTTLFGAFCAYLFLITGSIYPPIFAHIFCNVMGLPQIGLEIRRFPAHKQSIMVAYCIGIIGFAFALRPSAFARLSSMYWRSGSMVGWF